MPVDSITANTPANVAATSTVTRKLKQQLDSEDFMKLLAVQFQSQDPMKPMEDTAFISQMAQFSSLQQSSSLVKEMALLRSDQQNLAANSMLGRVVTVTGKDGNAVTGQVVAVQSSDAGPSLIVNGKNYSLSAVTRIENPVTTPATPAA